MEKSEYRAVIKFFTRQGKSVATIMNEMSLVYDDSCPGKTMVYKWHSLFKQGRESLEDDPRPGEQSNLHISEAMAENIKVAVVTGSNKGIGFAIVKGLCEKFNGVVYLTSRDAKRGEDAVSKLKTLGYNPSFHQLDVNDQASVDKLKDHIKNTHGGVDILINNAGIATDTTDYASVKKVIDTNYYGLLRVSETFFPILRQDARIVNVSSSLGHLSKISSATLREKFSDSSLSVAKLNELMEQYLKDYKDNVAVKKGWAFNGYYVSKVGVSALTRVHQKLVNEKYQEKNISINSVHPGYVNTDMTDHLGILTPDEGAKSSLFAALEAKNLKGQYIWNDNRVVEWTASSAP
ncbi:carbonyl reductase 1-related [Holotrichia oblita]|uniref:Carbonyl reductase 1-related n=1 Tax=Holotrichia oblita TaxID=644536 RepID=A0ACB9T2U5_HOLOL|nr:carbonyl reductase 1-related [Holotrichia oblita]